MRGIVGGGTVMVSMIAIVLLTFSCSLAATSATETQSMEEVRYEITVNRVTHLTVETIDLSSASKV